MLSQEGIHNGFIHWDTSVDPAIYRVRIGPVANVVQYDQLVDKLAGIGIADPYLISE